MRNNTNSKTERAGFTLIELLVVIAIVAVIAAILFPVFAGVRERGRRTVCQSNLKQIAIAMQQYVQDYGGVYPPSINWENAAYSYTKTVQVVRCPDLPDDSPEVHYTYDVTWLNVFPPPYPSKTILGAREFTLATHLAFGSTGMPVGSQLTANVITALCFLVLPAGASSVEVPSIQGLGTTRMLTVTSSG